jgi:3-oxoacyl-[acyl-carrier protein] reductase
VPTPLAGRVAIVTGANQGIGAATAIELARLGADVVIGFLRITPIDDDPGRPDEYRRARVSGPDDVVEAVRALGRRAVAVEGDLSQPSTPAALFDAAEAELGPVDILVNNASGWRKDSFTVTGTDHLGRRTGRVDAETADAQLLVDARGGALMISELARRHEEGGRDWGRIISLTSGGPMGFPGEVSYGAAKAALENYTMSAALELARFGITANVVYPPVTDTGWITDDVRRFVETSQDHFHVAAPEDVATVIGWLCTDEARLVTGNIIRLR